MTAGRRLAAGLGLVLCLAGCSGFVGSDQLERDDRDTFWLDSASTAGQTFVATEAGLSGIEVFLVPDSRGERSGQVELRLRSEPGSMIDVATARLPIAAITRPGFYRFAFPPQAASRRQDYDAVLSLHGTARLGLARAPGRAYAQGSFYVGPEPAEAQLVFRLVYDPLRMLTGLLVEVGVWLWRLLLAVLLFIVPGFILLRRLWPATEELGWAERLGLAGPVSIAVYTLACLGAALIGVRLGRLLVWLPLTIALATLAVGAWRGRRALRARWPSRGWRAWWAQDRSRPVAVFLVLLALVLVTRFGAARQLDLPLWGDSYHHTMIGQLMVDHGGLFDSWAPYAELRTFTYHFGFHTQVALFHWLTGQPVASAVVWIGQMLNVLAVLGLYPLAVRLAGDPWAGATAVLVAGLLSPMPMSYTNWGRYTQLTAHVLLPALVCVTWVLYERGRRQWGLLVLGILLAAGLALTHYRVLLFWVLFLPALTIVEFRRARSGIVPLVAVAAGAGLLVLPWVVHVFDGQIPTLLKTFVRTAAESRPPASVVVGNVGLYPPWFWALALLSGALAVVSRTRAAALVLVWWALIVTATNSNGLRLPGEGVISNFAVFIAAYMAVALLGGIAASALATAVGHRWQPALIGGLVVAGLWGASSRVQDVRPAPHMLAARPDTRAARWIDAHLPRETRLLINGFFAYGGSVVVGSDGGWWLPLLAHRPTTIPPITYGFERGPRADYREWVNALPRAIEAQGLGAASVLRLLAERGVTHLYLGQQRGRVNHPGPAAIRAEALLGNPHFRPVYHHDRVWIFEIVPSPGDPR